MSRKNSPFLSERRGDVVACISPISVLERLWVPAHSGQTEQLPVCTGRFHDAMVWFDAFGSGSFPDRAENRAMLGSNPSAVSVASTDR